MIDDWNLEIDELNLNRNEFQVFQEVSKEIENNKIENYNKNNQRF